ncbi:MAG: primosomal protein N' [Actinomycetota bacterium]|nr:primosomal protein N' [Actinomycetota bacterium]
MPAELDVRVGSLVRVPFGSRKVRGVVVEIRTGISERPLEPIARLVVPVPLASPAMVEVLEWVAQRYVATRGTTFSRIVPPRVRVAAGVGGTASSFSGERAAKVLVSYVRGRELIERVENGGAGTWSLRTLPGEDRGTVIAELLAAAARCGTGCALVAVPEVRYGSHILDRLTQTFPEFRRVDSSQAEGTRSQAWLELARGHPVAGGGRATVFAPADPLRLIVVDEEHHRSYKDERSPRIDARRVAIERARVQQAVCVLVSTAPSVETGAAVRTGAIAAVEPDRPAMRSARPVIEFVERDPDRPISHTLHERIRDELRAGGKIALLAPAGGYARALWCGECRRSVRCPVCEAGMIYGQSTRSIRCPRCGLRSDAPSTCPSCGAAEFRYVGSGSERLAEQMAKSFPRATVTRADAEVLAAGVLPEHGDIYVTTWIGTKAVLRPEVSLVAVIDADAMIRRPDFRAAETAYQALVDMVEWAGPASSGGRLVIHTSEPGHHCLQAIARADYSFFLERELRFRQELGYPPFSELVKIGITGADRVAVTERVVAAGRGAGARVLGPIEAGPPEGRRLEVLLKCEDAGTVAPRLRDIVAATAAGTSVRVDVDPR